MYSSIFRAEELIKQQLRKVLLDNCMASFSTMKMVAIDLSETSTNFYQTIQRHIVIAFRNSNATYSFVAYLTMLSAARSSVEL
jgi:hypothetical protein